MGRKYGKKKKIYDPQHLTKRQAEVYEYIKAFKKEKQIPPSVREMQIALGFKSTASIFKYLNDLEKMGLIRRNPAHPRSLEVMKKQFSEETKKRIRMLPMLVSADNKDELFQKIISERRFRIQRVFFHRKGYFSFQWRMMLFSPSESIKAIIS